MTYSADSENGVHSWQVKFTHSSGVQLVASILNSGVDNQQSENTKDAVFQGLVTKIAELAGVTIDSAVKTTILTANCTA